LEVPSVQDRLDHPQAQAVPVLALRRLSPGRRLEGGDSERLACDVIQIVCVYMSMCVYVCMCVCVCV
jgi:hypothetical protein